MTDPDPIDTAKLRELARLAPSKRVALTKREDGSVQLYFPNNGPMRVIVPAAETTVEYGPLFVAAVNNLVPLCNELDAARERVRELEELVEDMRLRQHDPVWDKIEELAKRVVARADKEPTDGE